MSKTAYIEHIASQYNMESTKAMSVPILKGTKLLCSDCPTDENEIKEMKTIPYHSAVGSLLFVALGIHPNISYTVCTLAHFAHNPGQKHWNGVKSVIHYLQEQFIAFPISSQGNSHQCVNSSWLF